MKDSIVVVGAGTAAAHLAIALREGGHAGRILLVGDEPFLPYDRPLLSKRALVNAAPPSRLMLQPDEFWQAKGIEIASATPARRVDVRNRRVLLGDGGEIRYDVLVLATGLRARRPPIPGTSLRGVQTLRTLHDLVRLRSAIGAARHPVIVGAGQTGLEAAAALRAAGREVTVIESADRVMGRLPSPVIERFVETLHRERGVTIRTGSRAGCILGNDRVHGIALADGTSLMADLVLLAVGGEVNHELAISAGLACNDGILVDEWCRTSAPDVLAVGDCARFPSARYQRSIRVESVRNASAQAAAAAATLLGTPRPYDPVPAYRSEQFDAVIQVAGLADGHDAAEVVGEPGSGRFSVEYRRRGRLIAVDSINDPEGHARGLDQVAAETDAALAPPRATGGRG